jgi:glycosyltransferase involved in cell wall biosynthesis
LNVSVIIPVFNAQKFLEKSILSVLSQAQTGEIILVDDGSTDESLSICHAWTKKEEKIKVFINDSQFKGAGAARNLGLKNATCDFIAFLDADDYYLTNRFDNDEIIFDKFSKIEAICNTIIMVSDHQNALNYLNGSYKNGQKIGFSKINSIVSIKDILQRKGVHLNGLTIKKSVIDKIGKFDVSLIQPEDVDFILRLIMETTVMSDDGSPKACYVIHDNNSIKNVSQAIYYRRKLAKKHFKIAIVKRFALLYLHKNFIDFMEYDYLWFFGKNHALKKYSKAVLLPFFIFRILSKTDPAYDKDRTIQLS